MKEVIRRKFLHLILFLVATGNQIILVSAQDALPDSLVRERIQVIQEMLDNGKKGANVWWYGWLAGYSAATVAQGSIVILSDNLATRQDMALGAITTLLGAAGQLIAPMTPGYAPDRLKAIPEGNPELNRRKLEEAEKLLEVCALREKEGRSWKMHVLDGTVNLGCGMIVWLGFKRTIPAGLENFTLNTVICEAQIFSQPTRAIRDYAAYCRKFKADQNLSCTPPRITWYFMMVPGGIGVKMLF